MDPFLATQATAAAAAGQLAGSCKLANAPAARATIFSLPEEVNLKIIALLDPFDVWSLARTCKSFAKLTDNDLLWRHQWTKLSAKTPFHFPPSQNLQVRQKFGRCATYLLYVAFLR